MELSINLDKSKKERRSSFWRYLPGFSRKIKEKPLPNDADVTLVSANKLYSSFRSLTNKKTPKGSAARSKDTGSDPSQDVHKDAGILFLTSDNQLRWRLHEETMREKHVQFAPTPLNKYHTYSDIPKFNKENVCPSNHPVPKILKHHPEFKTPKPPKPSNCHNKSNSFVTNRTKGPSSELKTFSLPRTSTKSVLSNHSNVTLTNFDVSAISNESLGDRSGISRRSLHSSSDSLQMSHSSDKKTTKRLDNHVGIPFISKTKPSLNSTRSNIENETRSKSSPGPTYKGDKLRRNSCVIASKSFVKSSEIDKIYRSQYLPVKNDTASKTKPSDFKVNKGEAVSRQHVQCNTHQTRLAQSSSMGSQIIQLRNTVSHQANLPSANADSKRVDNERFPCKNKVPVYPSHPQRSNFQKSQSLRIKNPVKNSICHNPQDRKHEQSNSSMHHTCGRSSFREGHHNLYSSVSVGNLKGRMQKSENFLHGPVASSPNYAKSRMHASRTLTERNYDGMSSVADDECSLNCSCLNCDDDELSLGSSKTRVNKRNSLKTKLFFPEQALPTIHSPRTLIGSAAMVRSLDAKSPWYDCSDSMCQSPGSESNVITRKSAVIPIHDKAEPIYANDIVIVEDYDVLKHKEVHEDKSSAPSAEEPSDSEKDNDNCTTETISAHEMTPKTKKLSESCVMALQETLKNLLSDSRSKPIFTISGFNSNNGTGDNTIVIQIQNSSEPSSQSSHDIGESDGTLKLNGIDMLNLSQSLPNLSSADICIEGEENLSPHRSSVSDNSNFSSCHPLDAAEETNFSTETIQNHPNGWEETPSIASNSGYSTVSSTLSGHQSGDNCSEIDNEDELLGNVIRQGMRLSCKKPSKMPSFTVASPRKSKFKAKDVLSGKAKLKLNIYHNCGMVTVHVVKAVKLSSVRTINLNPYVKVLLFPDESRRAHWRTNVVRGDCNPVFDQKFSFEIVPDDSKRRLIFSVWHRDKDKKRSEFLGCMSFGMYHCMDSDKSLSGWYRLLKEVVGTKKHFAAGRGHTLSKILAH